MDENERGQYRIFFGMLGGFERCLAVALPLLGVAFTLHLPDSLLGISVLMQQYVALFLAAALLLVFMGVPATRSAPRDRWPWYDILLAVTGCLACLYVVGFYPTLILGLGQTTLLKSVLGAVILVCVLEATRRVAGWTLTIVVLVFMFYAKFTNLFPGFLYGQPLSWARLFNYVYLGADAVFGSILAIAATTVLAFILFGQFLSGTGGSTFLINLAQGLMGRYRGGPAKVAVVASGLFGMISGSAVANVVSTGVITIPMMKRTGYPPYFAGAVEATASTGGSIMPPVMGAAAFLMAQFLDVSYASVAVAAFIPALLYYLGVFVQVDLRAAKIGLKGLERAMIPSIKNTLAQGWIFIVPMVVLIYAMLVLYLPAELAAMYSVASLLIVAVVRKESRRALAKIPEMLESAGWALLDIGIVCAVVGFVVGLVSVTGLAFSLPQALVSLAGGNIYILLLLTAGITVIMGMGLPITASYALMAVIAAPALVRMGIAPVAAHMFVLYFAAMSFITPPVALAAYAAASLAGAPMMQTGWQAVRLAIAAYLVPFVFVFHLPLLAVGSAVSIITAFATTAIGVVALAMGLEGYIFLKLTIVQRVLLGVAGLLIILPEMVSTVVGVIIVGAIVGAEAFRRKRIKAAALNTVQS